uniref:Late endosomal/lysosomal adaptor and MAPK and MTOR activator 5 n=1 Tax=Mesocestoides corti TaxID=53468 RepID=A0A5K3F6H9_MESCO
MPLDRRETRDWLRPGGSTCLSPNPTPHHSRTTLHMENQLLKHIQSVLPQVKDTAIQCFDTTGLPLLSVGKSCSHGSNLLPAIHRHALLLTDSRGETSPVVVVEREKRRLLDCHTQTSMYIRHTILSVTQLCISRNRLSFPIG